MTPSVRDYLGRLPDALRSYPDTVVKMSVVRAWIDGHDAPTLQEALPDELDPGRMLQRPVTAWVPEVHATVVYLTLRDSFYENDDSYVDAALHKNAKLLRSPLYRIVTRLFSRHRIRDAGVAVFQRMHRGVEAIVDPEAEHLTCTLQFPPHLVPPLIGRCYATALLAAVQLGGCAHAEVRTLEHTPTRLTFLVEGA